MNDKQITINNLNSIIVELQKGEITQNDIVVRLGRLANHMNNYWPNPDPPTNRQPLEHNRIITFDLDGMQKLASAIFYCQDQLENKK